MSNNYVYTSSYHYNDVIMSAMASQITSVSIGCSTVGSKLHVTCLCVGNSTVTGELPAQKATNMENVSIWWCHDDSALLYDIFLAV